MSFIFRLFEEHGELLNLFEKFKELKTKEDQANSLELQEHASTVMNTLDEGIKGLDNLDAFFEYLHQVGASHRRIPGFKVEYFWVSYANETRIPVSRIEIRSFLRFDGWKFRATEPRLMHRIIVESMGAKLLLIYIHNFLSDFQI